MTAPVAMMAKSPWPRATSRNALAAVAATRKRTATISSSGSRAVVRHVDLEAPGADLPCAAPRFVRSTTSPSSSASDSGSSELGVWRAQSSRRPCLCCGSGSGRRWVSATATSGSLSASFGQLSSFGSAFTAAPTSIGLPVALADRVELGMRAMSTSTARVGQAEIEHRHQRLPAGQHAGVVAVFAEDAMASSALSGRT